LSKELLFLEMLDLGSTGITNHTLTDLVSNCPNLKTVKILGCKKLNVSDDLILKRRGINVEAGEDVFRFNLVPKAGSDLLRVTNSVLKTRSTLSLYKVQKYLIKKLSEVYAELGCSND